MSRSAPPPCAHASRLVLLSSGSYTERGDGGTARANHGADDGRSEVQDPATQTTPRSPRRPATRAGCWTALVLACLACNEGGTIQGVPDAAADAVRYEPQPLAEFTLNVEHRAPVYGRTGPLRASIRDVDSGQTTEVELAPRGAPRDASFALALAAGDYRVTVYYDRAGDGALDDCPFPPSPADTADPDRYDNLQGAVRVRVEDGGEATVALERRICGPGERNTGITGAVRAPAGVTLDDQPVLLLLDPVVPEQVAADAGVVFAPARVIVPLFPAGFAAVGHFEIGELVPGTYRMTFFADGDRDGQPTPCGAGVGGGDRYAVTVPAPITVVAGQRVALPVDPVLVADPGCADALTGVRFSVELADGSVPEGPLRMALSSEEGGEPIVMTRLADGWAGPRAFTVSGLPAGYWRLLVWLDRDDDGAFLPCGGIAAGLDRVYAIGEVRIRDGEITTVGEPLQLVATGCDEVEMTQLTGVLWLPAEEGPVGSGRPVRLELLPVDDTGERRSILLFDNHRQVPAAPAPFARGVVAPTGRYVVRIYLDSDGDGGLTPCTEDPYGDRAAAPEFVVVLGDEPVVDLGERSLPDLGCEVPPASLRPRIRVAPGLVEQVLGDVPLRVRIEEWGGWTSDRPLTRPDALTDAGFEAPAIRLAPGQFSVTVYFDSDHDEAFSGCRDRETDPLFARVDLALTAETPSQSPLLTLDLGCGP